jgi:hypothetical protein
MDVRVRNMVITLSVAALAALTVTQTASATSTTEPGLWSSTYTAAQTACGTFARNGNNFCWTQGGDGSSAGPGVELGVKFTASQDLNITGVRVYRVSPGTVTGHLWDGAGGQPLASGTFDGTGTNSWQDLLFNTPVSIQAGHTYVASYHVTDAQYAFQYGFYASSGDTVGPITALSSPDSSGNGVYCYDNDPTNCATFPVNTFRDTNYWVTPLWGYNFSGFFQPVDNLPTLNIAKAGSAIPVKFSLGGDQGSEHLPGRQSAGDHRVLRHRRADGRHRDDGHGGEQLPAVRPYVRPVHLRLEDQFELGRDMRAVRAWAQRREHAHLPRPIQEVIDPNLRPSTWSPWTRCSSRCWRPSQWKQRT